MQTDNTYDLILDSDKDRQQGKLYLGDATFARDLDSLRDLGITVILCVCSQDLPRSTYDIEDVKRVLAKDNLDFPLNNYFKECLTFIHKYRSQNKNVLVHCGAGISRSATIVLAYLIQHLDLSLDDAFVLVQQKRPRACPNSGFWDQLVEFEKTNRGLGRLQALDKKVHDLTSRTLVETTPEELNLWEVKPVKVQAVTVQPVTLANKVSSNIGSFDGFSFDLGLIRGKKEARTKDTSS